MVDETANMILLYSIECVFMKRFREEITDLFFLVKRLCPKDSLRVSRIQNDTYTLNPPRSGTIKLD